MTANSTIAIKAAQRESFFLVDVKAFLEAFLLISLFVFLFAMFFTIDKYGLLLL
jgi:hypothetical protein